MVVAESTKVVDGSRKTTVATSKDTKFDKGGKSNGAQSATERKAQNIADKLGGKAVVSVAEAATPARNVAAKKDTEKDPFDGIGTTPSPPPAHVVESSAADEEMGGDCWDADDRHDADAALAMKLDEDERKAMERNADFDKRMEAASNLGLPGQTSSTALSKFDREMEELARKSKGGVGTASTEATATGTVNTKTGAASTPQTESIFHRAENLRTKMFSEGNEDIVKPETASPFKCLACGLQCANMRGLKIHLSTTKKNCKAFSELMLPSGAAKDDDIEDVDDDKDVGTGLLSGDRMSQALNTPLLQASASALEAARTAPPG